MLFILSQKSDRSTTQKQKQERHNNINTRWGDVWGKNDNDIGSTQEIQEIKLILPDS